MLCKNEVDGKAESVPEVYVAEVQLWDAMTGKAGALFTGHAAFLYSVFFTPDSKKLILLGSQELRGASEVMWLEASTGWVLAKQSFRYKESPTRLILSPNGKCLAAICQDSAVRLWDIIIP